MRRLFDALSDNSVDVRRVFISHDKHLKSTAEARAKVIRRP